MNRKGWESASLSFLPGKSAVKRSGPCAFQDENGPRPGNTSFRHRSNQSSIVAIYLSSMFMSICRTQNGTGLLHRLFNLFTNTFPIVVNHCPLLPFCYFRTFQSTTGVSLTIKTKYLPQKMCAYPHPIYSSLISFLLTVRNNQIKLDIYNYIYDIHIVFNTKSSNH